MQTIQLQTIDPAIHRIWLPRDPEAGRCADPSLSNWARERVAAPGTEGDSLSEGGTLAALSGRQLHVGYEDDGSVHITGSLTSEERLYGAYDADATSLQRRGEHIHLGNELHIRGMHATTGECPLCDPPDVDADGDADVTAIGRYGELHLPIFYSSAGYAVFVSNTTSGAVLDLGQADPDSWSFTAQAGEADVYVLGPGSLTELMQLYTRLTGQQPLPPTWALGFLQSRFGYETFEHALDVVDRFTAEQLPVHGLVFDVQWLEEFVNLRWHPERFPDPEHHVAQLKEHGVRTIVITEPGTRSDASNYQSGAQAGHFVVEQDGSIADSQQWYAARGFGQYIKVTPTPGAFVNFFSDAAGDWWYDQHRHLLEQGVDAWWLDLNEPEDFRDEMIFSGCDWPAPADELPGDQGRNIYALAQQRAFMRGDTTHSTRRPFVLSRSGAAGSQRYGAAPWSGDVGANWEEMRLQPHLMLSAAMCGIALWGCDVGGFHGDPSPELFVRWMQMGAFVPVFRAHGARADREPWSKGAEALEHIRPALILRAQLLPSVAAWTQEALVRGLPLVRPLLMEYPDDDRWHDCYDQWLFGPLLVAPVLNEGVRTRNVELPPGEWIDLWTGESHSGGGAITVSAELGQVPVFVPAGTALIVDPTPLVGRGRVWPPEQLDVWSFPDTDGRSSTRSYVDDGITRAHESGDLVECMVSVDGDSLTVAHVSGSRIPPEFQVVPATPGVSSATPS